MELKDISVEKPAASLLIGIFFYLSAVEAVLVFLYYLSFYNTNDWWAYQPRVTGNLISLPRQWVLFASLGYYFSTHPQKAAVCSTRLTNRYLFISLVTSWLWF
jgi:hypothetical protein